MTTVDLTTLHLAKGSHAPADGEMCLLEAAAYIAGEPWTDQPACVSPVIGVYGRQLNDVLPDGKRQLLKPYLKPMLNTAGDGQDEARSFIALDWLIRTYLPAWLRLVPSLVADADVIANSGPITTLDEAAAIGDAVRAASSHAVAAGAAARAAAWHAAGAAAWAAAWDAARAAAGAAARDAARAAARAAAGAAARVAAWAAAWDAAWDAAGAAAWIAAGDAVTLTVEALQDSAIALTARIVNPEVTA